MTNGILPVSNIINVSITGTPSGLTEKNVNSLALFTTETPNNLDAYGIYVSAAQVAEDYGTNSVTAQMASAIFSQSPNLLSGRGRLVIIPLLNTAESAEEGYFTTTDIHSNVSNIEAVTNGDLKVTIDSVAYNLTGVDFSGVASLDDIAEVLQGLIVNATITATSTAIVATSKKCGADSNVTISHLSGSGTDLSGSNYFNTSAGTATVGTDSDGETIAEAITRTEGVVSYVGVITNLDMEDDVIEDLADFVQAKDMIFIHHFASTADIAGIATTIKNSTNTKTRCVGYFQTLQEANLMKAAYAGRAFSVNFSGSNTSQTLNLKPLSTIDPDTNVTETLWVNAGIAGLDLYVSYDGVPCIYSTGGNLFFDQIYSRLALKFALETGGFNFLRQTNTKVPQTEKGMDGLKNAYSQVLVRFVRNGYIGIGLTWNSSEKFGNPEDLLANVTEKGYYIYSLPIALQSQSEREDRIAPLVQIAVKEAGSIHSSDVEVVVEP